MPVTLNEKAFDHAKTLILEDKFVWDERDDWSEHRPSSHDENEFIRLYGINEYAKWYLGIDRAKSPDIKGAYEFPYGDFKQVHRCGVISAESRAAQYKHADIAAAVAHLHGMIEARHGGLSCVEPDMDTKFFVRIGDQVLNADNVVSFDIDGSDVVRIWYVGSETPLELRPPVPAAALLEVLHAKQWLL